MMTSLFDVIAHEDLTSDRNVRKATVVAHQRVENTYGAWIRQDPHARIAHLNNELANVVRQACEEYGVEDTTTMARVQAAVYANYRPKPVVKEASVEHESARLPKMCPFHKDVVEISLAQGDPSAGFSALAPHWGTNRHCEGDGYEGDKCKFKPQMTTGSYWTERKEKAEQRRQEREQQAELEAQQQAEETETLEEFEEPLDQETEVSDNVVEVDFGADNTDVSETSAPEAEVPMSMAAGTRDSSETTGLGGPEPKIDKGPWSPKALEGVDDPKGPHPTKKKDIAEPVKVENNDIRHPGENNEIGGQVTERQDATKDSDGPSRSDQGGTWTKGPATAVSSVTAADDPYKNPILELMESDYEGFTPEAIVQSAIVAHKRHS